MIRNPGKLIWLRRQPTLQENTWSGCDSHSGSRSMRFLSCTRNVVCGNGIRPERSGATLFWVEQDVQHTIPGELLNISGGGAAVITEPHPPANTYALFGTGDRGHTDYSHRGQTGRRLARYFGIECRPTQLRRLLPYGNVRIGSIRSEWMRRTEHAPPATDPVLPPDADGLARLSPHRLLSTRAETETSPPLGPPEYRVG